MFYASLIFIALLVFTKGALNSHSDHLVCGSLNKNLLLKLENGQKLYSKVDPKIIIKSTALQVDNDLRKTWQQHGTPEKLGL